ncbi:MAG: type II secretion system protein, partial [Actinobacteria bacterium]|nr:type II secretion system protein [Actinomycetota bacterium]
MPGRARPSRSRGEAGLTLVELMVSLMILTGVMSALGGVIGISYKTVALSRERQVAEAAVNQRLEEVRDIDFARLSLTLTAPTPAHSTDPTNPDFYVSADGASYDVTGTGKIEPLVIDTPAPGTVDHVQSPVVVGSTQVDIYQYVTVAATDANGNATLKRVTVVARYRAQAFNGTAKILRESVTLTPGSFTIPSASSTTTTTGVPSTTTTVPTTTTTTPACSNKSSVPTVSGSMSVPVIGGAQLGYTATQTVTVQLPSLTDTCQPISVRFSNDATTWGPWTTYDPNNPSVAWTLGAGDGTKTVYGQAEDPNGNPVSLGQSTLTLDTTPPTAPASVSYSASCSGSTRNVTITWSAASDLHLVGYRLFTSTDGGNTWAQASNSPTQ